VNKYREGKGEKNRGERSEKNLKPLTYNHSKPYRAIYGDGTAFCIMSLRVVIASKVKWVIP